jgi:CRISPR-associated protein Cmr1
LRALPSSSPAPRNRKSDWTREAHVVLITRLFGGGARAREIDKVSWLRSSAAKSALRAWWRAGHAHEFSSLEALRERELVLFGATASFDADGHLHGGPGALEVETQSHLGSLPTDYDEPLGNPLNYALFPAQGMGQPRAKVVAASDQTQAVVKLTSLSGDPKAHETFLEALRLWLTLGGVGARSRRGAGAIAVDTPEEARKLGLPASLVELEAFLRERCRSRSLPSSLAGVFCLARTRRVFFGPLLASGEEAQKKLLGVLREARQDRPRPPEPWGRSRWPEADAIRIKADPGRTWNHRPVPANAGQYPRSILGLPIVVHFKTPPAEPDDHHILGAVPHEQTWKKLERYSSPVILRPVRVWEGNRMQYAPVAVFTDCTLPTDARPLVTTDPKTELNPAEVVRSYAILHDADQTLRRIESAFASAPGFHPL